MTFVHNAHTALWEEALVAAEAVRDDGSVKPDFGASLYIITGAGFYPLVKEHIHPGWIDFEAMLRMDFHGGNRTMIQLAGNLYNGRYAKEFSPIDIISECDLWMVQLAAKAIEYRKQGIGILHCSGEKDLYILHKNA